MANTQPYGPLDVIRREMAAGLSVTAIVVERTAQGARLMFEDGTHGVDFAHYTTTALYPFKVIG
jgi:hypothetical protein